MSSDPVIVADGLAKAYRIYAKPADRLKQALVPRLRRLAAPVLRAAGLPTDPPPFFTEHWALRPLSFEVRRGETLGVLGRNGSGKSTLLQMICGTLTPTLGDVRVQGRVAALLELGSGFNPEYSGRENVLLNASILGLTQEQTLARMDAILAFADIGAAVEQPVKTYSSGMAMRLAFAVIAHVDADVLIIDEALAVGDAPFQQKCLRWLRGFQKHGTVLFVSHDTGAVRSFCERAIWLDKGVLRMAGSATEVSDAYASYVIALASGLAPEAPPVAEEAPAAAIAAPKPPAPELPPAPEPEGTPVFDWLAHTDSFGDGGAEIVAASLTRADGAPLPVLRGGEHVALSWRVRALREVVLPIVGFHVKDRLGQPILGDNSASLGMAVPDALPPGSEAEARFAFRMPRLQAGRYSITLTIASGPIDTHVQHHWAHDALFFDVTPGGRNNGVMLRVDFDEAALRLDAAA